MKNQLLEQANVISLSDSELKSTSGGGFYWGTYYINNGDGTMQGIDVYIRGDGSWYYYHFKSIDGVYA